MEFLTKEKSKQKRKGVNNQNNSASYFRLCNTYLHHHIIKKSIKKRPLVVLWMGSTSEGKIPFTKVGRHRRIKYEDIVKFKKDMKSIQRKKIQELMGLDEESGLYDT